MNIEIKPSDIRVSYKKCVVAILITLWTIFTSMPIFANDMEGRTYAGDRFLITTLVQKKKDVGYHSQKLTISYKSGAKFPARTYVYEGQAVPSIKIGRFGNVVIGERIGGMDGMYVATYLTPVGGALNYLGGVEVSMANGKFVSASIKQNNWNENIGNSEREKLLANASSHADDFFETEGASAIDDVLLFFAVPDLMAGALERNHDFARDYSKMIVEKIDSSLGNMIRRRFVGRNQSL